MTEDADKLTLVGPPSADWTGLTGPVGDVRYIDTGVNKLPISVNFLRLFW